MGAFPALAREGNAQQAAQQGVDWANWRMSVPPPDPQDPTTYPMGPGALGGVVRGATPAADGLANFVRRVWPSLGRTADNLPDITVSFQPGRVQGQRAYYSPRNREIVLQDEIRYDSGYDGPRNVSSSIKSYIHELLHAIYESKGNTAGPTVTRQPGAGANIFAKVGPKSLDKERYNMWGDNFDATYLPDRKRMYEHAALDAIGQQIVNKRIIPPKVHPRWR